MKHILNSQDFISCGLLEVFICSKLFSSATNSITSRLSMTCCKKAPFLWKIKFKQFYSFCVSLKIYFLVYIDCLNWHGMTHDTIKMIKIKCQIKADLLWLKITLLKVAVLEKKCWEIFFYNLEPPIKILRRRKLKKKNSF